MTKNEMFKPLGTILGSSKVKPKKDEGIAIPIPDNAEKPKVHPQLGRPTYWWFYNTEEGKPILIVCRFFDKEDNKQDRPLTYRKYKDGSFRWAWKSTAKPRRLYQRDVFERDKSSPVLVCEGEKAAYKAQELLPDFVATTSPNGAGSPHLADWTPCSGRIVYIWPDNDEEGLSYGRSVAKLALDAGATAVFIVQIPEGIFCEGWDLADDMPSGWTQEDLRALIYNAQEILPPYGEAMKQAKLLTRESHPKKIEAVLSLVSSLSVVEQRRVKKVIKKEADMPLRDQDQIIKELFNGPDDEAEEPDHLGLAGIVIDSMDHKNILSTVSHVWLWREKGYWETLADLELKQIIQQVLCFHVRRVTRALVDAVFSVLKSEVFAQAHEWDLNPNIINVKNGELHFENGNWTLRHHNRINFRTTQIPHPYFVDATCPRFIQFLNEVFEGDDDAEKKKQTIWELMGYTLSNTAKFEKFVLLIGAGGNGKSVLLEVIKALVGSRNVSAVQPEELSNNFKRAYLHKKLANLITEIKQGGVIADAELKAITSGELITADHKHQHPFDFQPYCTCWFGTNHMPRTKDFSDALYRRAMIFRFNNKFKGKTADKNLKSKLLKELPGIMRLSLEAYAQVLQRGEFTEPPSSIREKETWRRNEDQVSLFVEECCIIVPESMEASGKIYRAYQNWALDQGIKRPLTQNNLTRRLGGKGFERANGTGGTRMISGLRIK